MCDASNLSIQIHCARKKTRRVGQVDVATAKTTTRKLINGCQFYSTYKILVCCGACPRLRNTRLTNGKEQREIWQMINTILLFYYMEFRCLQFLFTLCFCILELSRIHFFSANCNRSCFDMSVLDAATHRYCLFIYTHIVVILLILVILRIFCCQFLLSL